MHVQHVQPHRAGFDLPSLAVRRRKTASSKTTHAEVYFQHPLFSLFTSDACEGMISANRQDPPAKDGETWRRYKYETGHHRAHRARDIRLRRDGMTDIGASFTFGQAPGQMQQ